MSEAIEHSEGSVSERDTRYKVGQGNWHAFRQLGFELDRVNQASIQWAEALKGVERPWLCWKVDDEWCLVQQRLVRLVGWTPVVGFDPRSGPPGKVLDGAIVIDFNKGLDLPVLYPHFPLEFAFQFCDRLAFWHSDLLLRRELMEQLARQFAAIRDGETVATRPNRQLIHLFTTRRRRYWELVGCTSRLASLRQFQMGCGWWMSFSHHPNCPDQTERAKRREYHWDHGAGIYYWHRRYSGEVTVLSDKGIYEGHFTKIGNPEYKRTVPANSSDSHRLMGVELRQSFELSEACQKMGLVDLL